jgi:hypothetical protein
LDIVRQIDTLVDRREFDNTSLQERSHMEERSLEYIREGTGKIPGGPQGLIEAQQLMVDANALGVCVTCADPIGQEWLDSQVDLLIAGCRRRLVLEEEIASCAVDGRDGLERYMQAWKAKTLAWQRYFVVT